MIHRFFHGIQIYSSIFVFHVSLKAEENVMELDPTQFLAQDSSDDDSENEDDEQNRVASTNNGNDPSILTSLGLQHVNSATPYGSLAVSFEIN